MGKSPFVETASCSPLAFIKKMTFMKKLIGSAIILLLFSTPLFAETTIRITSGEWEPFLSEYSPHYGVNSHVVSEAFRLEGIDVRWEFFPWKRAYQMAKKGKNWDASATWWVTGDTRRAFLVSEPVGKTSLVFFHLKSYKFDWESIDDLKGLFIGGTLEYDYGKDFMAAMEEKRISVEFVPKDELNFRKLLKGRIVVFPNDLTVGYAQIRNTFPPDQVKLFTHHTKKIEHRTLHLIISRNCKNGEFFLDRFNSGLKKLKESGRFDQMFRELAEGKYDKLKARWKE